MLYRVGNGMSDVELQAVRDKLNPTLCPMHRSPKPSDTPTPGRPSQTFGSFSLSSLVCVFKNTHCAVQSGERHVWRRAASSQGEAEPLLCALCAEAQKLQTYQCQEDTARHVGQGHLQVHCATGTVGLMIDLTLRTAHVPQHLHQQPEMLMTCGSRTSSSQWCYRSNQLHHQPD